MKLLLKRKVLTDRYTQGELYVNDVIFCFTIEDKVRAKAGMWKRIFKIKGQTAIPYGTYPVLVTWSNRFKRMLTGVFNVPDFEGIRIHNGTSELSSEGCIIVSHHVAGQGKLVNDKAAMNQLCILIEDAQKKEKVTIEII
jgi:hypothetical protein